jgi:type VI secretion system protein ImpK
MNAAAPTLNTNKREDDLLAKTYWASADVLSLATQLGHTQQLLPVDELQRRIGVLFDQMSRRFREVGIPEEDSNEVKYAISAFIDEQLFRNEWPGRAQWLNRPLQLLYFNENTAGEGFYDHLEALRKQPAKANVVQIYYLLMELGFLGKYAVRPEGQRAIADTTRNEVLRRLLKSEVISPHAEPRDQGNRGLGSGERPVVAIAVIVLGAAILVFILMKLSVVYTANDAVTSLGKAAPQLPAGVGKP